MRTPLCRSNALSKLPEQAGAAGSFYSFLAYIIHWSFASPSFKNPYAEVQGTLFFRFSLTPLYEGEHCWIGLFSQWTSKIRLRLYYSRRLATPLSPRFRADQMNFTVRWYRRKCSRKPSDWISCKQSTRHWSGWEVSRWAHVALEKYNRIGSNADILNIQVPFLATGIQPGTAIDWNYTTIPQDGLNGRSISIPRGHVLGGSSSTSESNSRRQI